MARTFGGASTDKITFAASAAINNLVTQTWSAWVYRTGNGGGGLGFILDKSTGGGAGSCVLYFNTFPSNSYYFQCDRWTTTGAWYIASPSANVWHHLCVAYDAGSTANDPLFYVDGVSVAVTEFQAPAGTLASETQALKIGNAADNTRNWAGSLAELSCHNVVLTPTQVASLAGGNMAHTVLPANLVWYPPLWGLHSPEIDISANLALGTVTGTVASTHPPGIHETSMSGDVLTIVTEILDIVSNTATLAEVTAGVWALASAIDGKTPAQAMQIIAAAVAGARTGAGTSTETFKGLDTTTTRVTGTVDASGNRSGVTYP